MLARARLGTQWSLGIFSRFGSGRALRFPPVVFRGSICWFGLSWSGVQMPAHSAPPAGHVEMAQQACQAAARQGGPAVLCALCPEEHCAHTSKERAPCSQPGDGIDLSLRGSPAPWNHFSDSRRWSHPPRAIPLTVSPGTLQEHLGYSQWVAAASLYLVPRHPHRSEVFLPAC